MVACCLCGAYEYLHKDRAFHRLVNSNQILSLVDITVIHIIDFPKIKNLKRNGYQQLEEKKYMPLRKFAAIILTRKTTIMMNIIQKELYFLVQFLTEISKRKRKK